MKAELKNFNADYELALITYLNGGDEEAALQRAYELGRRAIAGEQTILGILSVHCRIMGVFPHPVGGLSRQLVNSRNESFLTQVMALFEMTHRQTLEMNQSLRESERRKAAIVGSAFDSIITFDSSGRIIDFNEAAEQMFGYQWKEVVGRELTALILPPAEQAAFQKTLAIYRERKAGTGIGERNEITARRADGSQFPIEIAVTYIDVDESPFFSAYLRDLTERKAYEARIEYLATHDALTNLANHNLLKDRVQQAIAHLAHRPGHALAILFLGIERFKFINDSLGHSFGDALIKAISGRLLQSVSDSDTLARQSGDEFVILISDLRHSIQDALRVASEVLALFMQPFSVEGHTVRLACSIGISLYPNDGTDVEMLLANADAAMHRAKSAGGGTVQFYTRDLSTFAAERVRLENALWSGLEKHEFNVYYQPQVRVSDGAIVGAEALLRWHHPELGMVQPDRFVGLAEETGLIGPIGEWVLETANAQNRAWQRQGFPPLRMAVNVSTRQFRHGSILKNLETLVLANQIATDSIELEVTESSLMEDIDESIRILHELRSLGASISLDDFGTGYSSLSYLRRLPVDRLKIDQSFVHDMEGDPQKQTMVREIIHLAQAFDLKIIAEGVETRGELDFLAHQGCHEYQGYWFSRPLTSKDFEALLQKGGRRQ